MKWFLLLRILLILLIAGITVLSQLDQPSKTAYTIFQALTFFILIYLLPFEIIGRIERKYELTKSSTVYKKMLKTRWFTPFVFIYWFFLLKKYKKSKTLS
ncbi:hypothetical protein SCHIN_v1c04750 [Spiroplasma chinense]|uniref:Uncharacterized protein n=1 Tax=Spiroplasma chinense TaxID=216932 RepID=A0A5B9Y6G7_9MOLU|nr:hypothetical protein SCHIN_v1c04750 [Spiroplasma chinense]